MIKAILFDFDGVLTIDKTGSEPIISYLAGVSPVPIDSIRTNYYKYNHDLLTGKTTHEQMWSSFCQDIGYKISFDCLKEAFYNTRLDQNMLKYIKELKKDYLIGMVTDNKVDRIQSVLQHYHLELYFDVVSISAECHSGKESSTIFETTLQKMNVMPEECVFIDNTERNLFVPGKMGMKTILFDDDGRDFSAFKLELERTMN